MNVPAGMELTEKDLELLMEAIGDYEKAPVFQALVGGAVSQMLSGAADKKPDAVGLAKAERDCKARQSVCIILRAKLELARQALQSAAIAAPDAGGAA